MTTESRTPGAVRPTDQRDEIVETLLGLRWAVPRTDAEARLALDRLAMVAVRLADLAANEPRGETPWDAPIQSLLAQAGFTLDWWRPALDDVDLDWTLNHQAHLAADLARIASAGARILDQYTPDAPPSAPAEQPPPPAPQARPVYAPAPPRSAVPAANRVAAVFGSVPDTLERPARHRRPAYDFDPGPLAPPSSAAPPYSPAAPSPGAPPVLAFSPSGSTRYAAGAPGVPATPPPAFTPPIVWSGACDPIDEDDEDDQIVSSDRRRSSAAMVFQAVGVLGAVTALAWWAAGTLHPGASAPAAPAGAQSTPAAARPVAPPVSAVASTYPGNTPVTSAAAAQPATSAAPPPPGGSAHVTALQLSLLGGSQAERQVAVVLSVNTSGTGGVTVTVDYYGMKNGARVAERTASWTVSGKTAYQLGDSIPANEYCGTVFHLTAASGDATATQSTAPGC